MPHLTDKPIDVAALLNEARSPTAGAVVLFLGTTREMTDGRQTLALDYEAYGRMAEEKLAELEAEARHRWPLAACLIVHRLGRVPAAEASVAIVVSTPHRREAFAAGQWLIDSLKEQVPSGNANSGPTAPPNGYIQASMMQTFNRDAQRSAP